jgi:hypothetical protein
MDRTWTHGAAICGVPSERGNDRAIPRALPWVPNVQDLQKVLHLWVIYSAFNSFSISAFQAFPRVNAYSQASGLG